MERKVNAESYQHGYYSVRDPNEGSSSSNWPFLYRDKSLGNGQNHNDSLARTFSNSFSDRDKDVIKEKMLEHEAIFKHQVVELHRLYKTQKNMMDEIKTKELHKHRMRLHASSSSSPFMTHMNPDDAWKSQKSKYPYLNSNFDLEINRSARGNIGQTDRFLSQSESSSKDCEILEVRPSSVKNNLFDLQLPAGEYNDKISDVSSKSHRLSSIDMNTWSKLKVEHNEGPYVSSVGLRNHIGLADLNKPVQAEEQTRATAVDLSNSSHFLLGLPKEVLLNPQYQSCNGISNRPHVENKGGGRERLSYTYEEQIASNLKIVPQGAQRDYSPVSHKAIDSTFGKVHHPSSIIESNNVRGDFWKVKERTVNGSQLPLTSRVSSLYHLEPVSTLTHKSISLQTNPPLNVSSTLNMSSQSSSQQSQDIWSRLYSKPSPWWIKDPSANVPPITIQSLKSNKYDKVASERSINYSPLAKNMNLNICPSKSSCIEIVDLEKECEDPGKGLPWLKSQPLKPPSDQLSTSASLKGKGKSELIDINVACDMECSIEVAEEEKPLIIIEKNVSGKEANLKALFDLNSYASDNEITVAPSITSTNANNNRRIMIDLEAPPVPESDEEVLLLPSPVDEAALDAAQAMVAMSSSTTSLVLEPPSLEPFLWFVDVVSSLVSPREIDEFEAMTLNLKEMTEEEYMPKPLCPELPKPDEYGQVSSSRSKTRRGGGRRGGRRRDFQRDILPGLVTLSRPDVSEDIQTFEELMRSTGQVWSSRLARRNGTRGGGRGKRRVRVDPPADDVAGPAEVCPSLTQAANIWGETPRRPRRQRVVPGNPSLVSLP